MDTYKIGLKLQNHNNVIHRTKYQIIVQILNNNNFDFTDISENILNIWMGYKWVVQFSGTHVNFLVDTKYYFNKNVNNHYIKYNSLINYQDGHKIKIIEHMTINY